MLPSFFFLDWSKSSSFFKRIWLAPSYVCAAPVLLNGFLTKVAESSHSGTDAFLAFCSTLSACMLLPYQATTT